jgi:hypothetical protein
MLVLSQRTGEGIVRAPYLRCALIDKKCGIGRLFLCLLLVADYAGDPYFGQSPLSRPLASQEAFCHSLIQRVVLLKATTPAGTMPGLNVPANGLHGPETRPRVRGKEAQPDFFAAADPVYDLVSLQC